MGFAVWFGLTAGIFLFEFVKEAPVWAVPLKISFFQGIAILTYWFFREWNGD